MKKLLFAVSVLVLGVSIGEARQVSTRFQCFTSCGQATNETCGWITRRGKYNACRNRLIRQCRRWGVATMCPAPPPPTTTTVPPPPPTTTTTATVPTTTTSTTLPYVDPLGQFEGTTWQFVFTLTTTRTDTFALGYTYTYTSDGLKILQGTDEYGSGVGMVLAASYGIPYDYLLVDPNIDQVCEAFGFDITSPTTVSGEVVFYYPPDCATVMGGPVPFTGYMQ